jgi:hypothetical protein
MGHRASVLVRSRSCAGTVNEISRVTLKGAPMYELVSAVAAALLAGCLPPATNWQSAPAGMTTFQATPARDLAPAARELTFNGHPATERDLQIVAWLEQQARRPLPNGAYWYDNASGLWGYWGGPAVGVMQAGLGLGGALPSDASHGSTRIFVNGRELHAIDVQNVAAATGIVGRPGRYWLDASGNLGYEGGPPIGNLAAASRARSNGGDNQTTWSRGAGGAYGPNVQTGPHGCVIVGGYVGTGC